MLRYSFALYPVSNPVQVSIHGVSSSRVDILWRSNVITVPDEDIEKRKLTHGDVGPDGGEADADGDGGAEGGAGEGDTGDGS